MEPQSTSYDSCSECGARLVLSLAPREYVCSKCGMVAPLPEELIPLGAEKFGRGIQSFGVLGNGLGSMMSMRNSNGSSDLYALRGDNGRYNPVVTSLMPGHLTGLEEKNKDLAYFKMNVVSEMEKDQSQKGRAITGDQGTQISNELRTWHKAIRELTSKDQPICMQRSRESKQMHVMVVKADFDKEYIRAFRNV